MPSYIDNSNPKYLIIDDLYYAGLIVVNYSNEQEAFFIDKIVNSCKNVNISIFYEKLDSYKTLRDLTFHIGNAKSNIKDSNEALNDIDNVISTLEGAKYIRKEMQINKEELYNFYLYILVYADNADELENNLRNLESVVNGLGVFTRRANFRQMQLFNSSLPIMNNSIDLKTVARRNILTKDLVCTYPFSMSQIYDENGVLFGINYHDNLPVIIDIFKSDKYKNSNICVFGSSGSRKVFFYKTFNIKKLLYKH